MAGTLEDSNTSIVNGSYKKRTSSGTIANLSAVDTTNNILTLANLNDALKFNTGDFVSTGSTTLFQISSIAGTKLYMSGAVTGIFATGSIRLASDETDLIGNVATGTGTTITSCTDSNAVKNIVANLCPISDSVVGLVPYKVN